VQDEVNQEENEQNEVDGTKQTADSTGEVMRYRGLFSVLKPLTPTVAMWVGTAIKHSL